MNPVRFGLIGYGAWGTQHAMAIANTEGAALSAIAVRSKQSQEAAQAAHLATKVYGDYRQMLATETLDVVDAVLPSHLHHEVAAAVLESGRHLLLEKPMALSLAECDHLNQLAAKHQRLLAIGHELRLSLLWGEVKRLVEAGAIGQPQYLLVELSRRPYRPGAEGWRFDIDRVGNWILEEPIHFFDLARWYYASLGEPLTIHAQANSRQPDHPELQDNFSALVTFPQGAYALITQTLSAFEHHQTVKLTGTKGALWASWSGAMDRTLTPTFWLKHWDGEQLHQVEFSKPTGEVYELHDQAAMLVRAVRQCGTSLRDVNHLAERGGTLATGHDGRQSVALCLAAKESVDTGRIVDLRPYLGA